MLIKPEQVNLIKQNKVCLVKHFTDLKNQYDFDFISDLIQGNDLKIISKTSIGNLKDVFQMMNVSNSIMELKIIFDFFKKLFQYETSIKDEIDLYFSFTSQIGNPHIDVEDVFIIGLNGKTVYQIFGVQDEFYEIKKGDLIFIPKGIKHKAIAVSSRIIGSIGFYGKRRAPLI